MLLSWYRKYGLDFTDANVDREDPDNDGFSNIVEFRNDPVGVRQKASDCDGSKSTNPLDTKDHPDYLARLRLQKYELRAFHIQFKGYNQVGRFLPVFQLHLSDVPSYNQPPMKKSGDELTAFKVISSAPSMNFSKTRQIPPPTLTSQINVSILELDKPEIGLKVIIPFRKIIDSPESTADFVMLMPADVDKVIKISRGKIFTVPELPGTSFRVMDANDKGATIRDTKTNKDYSIPKLDPAEWNEVPLPTPANSSKSP